MTRLPFRPRGRFRQWKQNRARPHICRTATPLPEGSTQPSASLEPSWLNSRSKGGFQIVKRRAAGPALGAATPTRVAKLAWSFGRMIVAKVCVTFATFSGQTLTTSCVTRQRSSRTGKTMLESASRSARSRTPPHPRASGRWRVLATDGRLRRPRAGRGEPATETTRGVP
jgi:hypothetical protein